MKHLFLFAVAFPLLAFGQVGSINVPLMLGTNAVPVSHPGFFDTNAAAIASAVAPVISLDAGRITSGVLPISRIATGTPTGTKFVRDDGTLATPAGGGGGSNFITSVSADFQVLLEALSLTNATGTGQLLRASTLSPYLLSATASTLYQPLDPDLSDLADGSLTGSKVGPGIDAGNITTGTLGDARIPATIARLESPQFTGTVGFEFLQADTVQVPWASRYATANGSSNLVGTLDGGSWTNLNGTEIRSGTVAAARIDSAIARLDSPAFSNNPTVPTQSLSTSNTTAASTAFAQQLAELRQLTSTILTQLAALTNGSAGQVPTWTGANTLALSNAPAGGSGTDTNWSGNPIGDGTITNLTVVRVNGARLVQQEKGGIFWDFVGAPPFMTALALASGASFPTTGTTNDPFALIAQTGGSSANSGHGYYTGASSYNVGGGEFWEMGWYIQKTNNVGFRNGLLDVLSATAAATDGIYLEQGTNGVYRGVCVANGSLTATASTYVPVEDPAIQYKGTWAVASPPTNVVFTLYTNNVSVWTDSISASIPTNSARMTGLGFFSWHGGTGSGTNLIKYGWFGFQPSFKGSR